MDGILNIYKEKGFTSHDVVAKLRKILHQKRIGHTGTLDPEAEGVLPICIGKATKLCGLLTEKEKCYRTTAVLGIKTDTQDTSGQVLAKKDTAGITESQILETILSFVGSYGQIPPMYSAKKVNGKKLYEYARQGIEVEREPVQVTILSIENIDIDMQKDTFSMDVTCSKGTYIRTLCHDIGEKLGCGAAMQSLLRTRVKDFTIQNALTLNEVEELVQEDGLATRIFSVTDMFPEYKRVHVLEEYHTYPANGNPVKISCLQEPVPQLSQGEKVWLYDHMGCLIGIYVLQGKGLLKPATMFFIQ